MTEPKKLIDWASVPSGTNACSVSMILAGKLLESDGKKALLHFCGIYETGIYDCTDLRLDFTTPQPWQVYEDGVTEVPEWAECEYRGVNSFEDGKTNDVVDSNKWVIDYIAHYRITGIKEGWTDKPNEMIA